MSFKIAYIPVVFFLGALTFFVCSVLGAVHAVSVAAAQTENRPVIVLDAGHGGEDGGAVGVNGVEEKTANLAIALFVREKLEAAGYPVKMIRETDTAVGDTTLITLNERKRSDILYRTQIVNETENCIFVSIHQNFFEQSQYSGAQMFYSANNAKSADLAETIRRAVIEQVQPDNTRACKQAESRVYILSHVDVPAVFAECGFLSNPEEAEKLCDKNYQKKLAAAIADGIIAFCKAE